MITIAVGTYIFGFDELLEAADLAIGRLGLSGFAQSGHSRYLPKHVRFKAFLDHDDLMANLEQSQLLICHAGMGLIGDGLRAGCRIILYPRRVSTSKANPANDQTEFAIAVSKCLGLGICLRPQDLDVAILRAMTDRQEPQEMPQSDVPAMITNFLMQSARA